MVHTYDMVMDVLLEKVGVYFKYVSATKGGAICGRDRSQGE